MTDTASRLRAQIPSSTDKYRLEREARRAEVRGERKLLHRLIDLEHVLKLGGFHMAACDVREAIERIQSYEPGSV